MQKVQKGKVEVTLEVILEVILEVTLEVPKAIRIREATLEAIRVISIPLKQLHIQVTEAKVPTTVITAAHTL